MTGTIQKGALFVDLENIFYALTTAPYHLLHDEALNAVLDLVAEVRERGGQESLSLIIERCYADFDQLPETAQRQFQIAGILPRYVDARKGKSSADIELSLDMLQELYTRDEIEVFILIGGDRDYLPILRRLKEASKRVVIWSFENVLAADLGEFIKSSKFGRIETLEGLIKVSDYKTKAQIIEEPRQQPISHILHPAPKPEFPLEKYDPHEDYEWETRYLEAMIEFMDANAYEEIHLGPFFRWLGDNNIMELISTNDKRRTFERLRRMAAVIVEERDSGGGYKWTAVKLNYNHPLVRKTIHSLQAALKEPPKNGIPKES